MESANLEHARGKVLRVLQITDCHLNKDASGALLGVRTLDSLDAVLEQIAQDQREPDLVLVTGDLVQDGNLAAYQVLQQRLSHFSCPIFWCPGNHDARKEMSAAVASGDELTKVINAGDWRVVMLDSLVEGAVHGELSQAELETLQQALSEDDQTQHVLVALHHHPVSIDSHWLDQIGLHNRDAFWQILDQFDHVKLVLWGHIHQAFDAERKGLRLLASPSTCIQFLPRSDDFALDHAAPGYRWLELLPDGTIDTTVVRAENFEFELDLASDGY